MVSRLMFVAVLAGLGQLTAPLLRETNSAAEVRRGIESYRNERHDEAVRAFESASKLRSNPVTSFDLGTAKVAAGQLQEGARELTNAAKEPGVAPDALYNRGNAALSANALDQAIRDYIESLRLRPGDQDAKRNLEIALLRRQASRQSQPQQQSQPTPEQPQQEQQRQQPSPGGEQEQQEETEAEALLRSVEQQEREELSRMRRARAARQRIGW